MGTARKANNIQLCHMNILRENTKPFAKECKCFASVTGNYSGRFFFAGPLPVLPKILQNYVKHSSRAHFDWGFLLPSSKQVDPNVWIYWLDCVVSLLSDSSIALTYESSAQLLTGSKLFGASMINDSVHVLALLYWCWGSEV